MNWNGFILYGLGMVSGTTMLREEWLLLSIASLAAGCFLVMGEPKTKVKP